MPVVLFLPCFPSTGIPQYLGLRGKNARHFIRNEVGQKLIGIIYTTEQVHGEDRAALSGRHNPRFPAGPCMRDLSGAEEAIPSSTESHLHECYHDLVGDIRAASQRREVEHDGVDKVGLEGGEQVNVIRTRGFLLDVDISLQDLSLYHKHAYLIL